MSRTTDQGASSAATEIPTTPESTEIRFSAIKFALHFAAMVVAMVVGMVVLHPIWMFVLDAVGAAALMENPYTGALIMATNMTVAMSAWMKVRGHRWRPIVEMGAAMYVPFLALFVPLGLELIDQDALMLWGHVLMLPAMAVAMLLRPHDHHAGPLTPRPPPEPAANLAKSPVRAGSPPGTLSMTTAPSNRRPQ